MCRERYVSRFNLFTWNKKTVLVYRLTRREKIMKVTEDLSGGTRVLYLREAILIKKAKWLSEEALQIAVKKKRSEKKRRKGKI